MKLNNKMIKIFNTYADRWEELSPLKDEYRYMTLYITAEGVIHCYLARDYNTPSILSEILYKDGKINGESIKKLNAVLPILLQEARAKKREAKKC
jgi:hypothetical protein